MIFSWYLEKNMHPHQEEILSLSCNKNSCLQASFCYRCLWSNIDPLHPDAEEQEQKSAHCQAFCSTTSYSLLYQTWKTTHHSCSKTHKPEISGQVLACYFHFSTVNSSAPYVIYCSQKQKGSLVLSPCLSSQHTTYPVSTTSQGF